MRSLPERFRIKVTSIESCIDLNTMKIEKLVGAIQAYEFSFPQPKKNKDLALRTLRKNFDELSDEESPDDEELDFIGRRYFKNEDIISKRFGKQKESTQDRNERDPCDPKCYVMSVLAMVMFTKIVLTSRVIFKPRDQKAFNITLSDTDEEETPKYVAFVASYNSDDSKQSNVQFASDNESNRVSDLQNSFDNLMEKFSMLRNTNLKIVKDFKNLKLERDNLLKSLSDSHAVCNTLKSKNHVLIAKNKSLQNDLIASRNHLSKFSSEKLDKMWHFQKHSSDRFGLGFDKNASLSSKCTSTSEIVFVKPVKVDESLGEGKPIVAMTHQGKEGKKNYIDPHASYPKPRVMHSPRKLPSQRFVPTCHHCGKVGHI
jgi:regulator of replication initiation timing